jgi:hypothetical protein
MIRTTPIYITSRKVYYDFRSKLEEVKIMSKTKGIRKYKNIHKNKRCFIIGNGPSLKAEDLTKLFANKEICFACNRINLIFDKTAWRPNYYFMSDPLLINSVQDSVNEIDLKFTKMLFPLIYKNKHLNGEYYHTIKFNYEFEGKFNTDVNRGIYPAGTITSEMIQMAYYMGFTKVYLLGVDFSYNFTNLNEYDLRTGITVAGSEKNHFAEGYLRPGEKTMLPNVKANLLGYNAAKLVFEKDGRKIYNATRGGKLEVFERVNFDNLFSNNEVNHE